MGRQVRINTLVDSKLDELTKELKRTDPFISVRQDVVSKAIIELHKKTFKK